MYCGAATWASFFRPSLHGRYPASPLLRRLLTSSPLSRRRSPQVRYRIFPLVPPGSTGCVSDDLWALLFPASLPPAPGLTAGSCSCGREFATRFFQLRLAATPCVSLRLPSSVPIGSFHPIRFCPCWAHYTRLQPRLFGVKETRLKPRVPHGKPGVGCGFRR